MALKDRHKHAKWIYHYTVDCPQSPLFIDLYIYTSIENRSRMDAMLLTLRVQHDDLRGLLPALRKEPEVSRVHVGFQSMNGEGYRN